MLRLARQFQIRLEERVEFLQTHRTALGRTFVEQIQIQEYKVAEEIPQVFINPLL